MFISNREKYLINKKLTEMEVAINSLVARIEDRTTISEDHATLMRAMYGEACGGVSVSLKKIVKNLIDVLGYKIDYYPTDPPPQKKVSYLLKKNTKVSKKKEKNK